MLLSVSQTARELGVSCAHVRRMVKAGRWPVYCLGPKAMRLDVEEIRTLGRLTAEAQKRKGN